jgi:Fibrinogen beta and gamma chains, C-terminal globular domain
MRVGHWTLRASSLLVAFGATAACGLFADQQQFSLASEAGAAVGCSPACTNGSSCGQNGDCASGICTAGKCIAPLCAPSCVNGNVCGAATDCASKACTKGLCTSPECGPTCADDSPCGANGDCGSGVCTGGKCVAPTCTPSCVEASACGDNDDCASDLCEKGHCSDAKNCATLLAQNPAAKSGKYEVDPDGPGGSAPLLVYCDMKTDGGGWTQVYDQNVNVSPGYQPISAWLAGVNETSPSSGQYSILNELEKLKNGSNYEFRLVWPTPPSDGSIQWTQVENPLTAPAMPTISKVQMTPAGQVGCTTFRGLAPNVEGDPAALEGDSKPSCFYWAVGTPQAWDDGIPSYSSMADDGTPEAQLWLR